MTPDIIIRLRSAADAIRHGSPGLRPTLDEAADEIERLRDERDGYRRGLALVQGEADPDWDMKFATVLIENATLVRKIQTMGIGNPEH